MSDYLKKQLVTGEQVRSVFRRHWLWLARRLLTSIIVTAIATGIVVYFEVSGWPMALPLLPVLYGAGTVISWWRRLLVVTSQRVLLLGGLVNSLASKDDLPLSLIGNVDDEPHGILGGLFGERDFNFQSGDPRSGIVADGFPEEVLKVVRQAQASVTTTQPWQEPGKGSDVLGRQY